MTDKHQEYLDSISEIRNMMDRSSRFISLSGLAGVFAGVWALCGAAYAFFVLKNLHYPYEVASEDIQIALIKLFADAMIVLVLAVSSGIFFTTRKAKRQGESIWDKKILSLIYDMAVPLGAGGFFCIVLMYYGNFVFVAPATLIFYGIALFTAGNYTQRDIKNLGVVEIVLGCINCFFLGKGLYFWAFGFGFMHIIYGIVMYFKYESKSK